MILAEEATSQALESLITRFGRLLRQVARHRGLTDAEAAELCQDVRIRLWHALTNGQRIAGVPASYVHRVAMSAALDMIRRRRARREEPLEDPCFTGERALPGIAVLPTFETAVEQEEFSDLVAGLVDGLAEPRDVAVRMYLAGHNHRAIARLRGWTEAKARNLLYRGLADLRMKLTALRIGPARVA
jgi:RNA polymerase sigma factor (sigma-70 family)